MAEQEKQHATVVRNVGGYKNDLTFGESRATMTAGKKPLHLDNCICATPTVQTPSMSLTSNGCHVTLFFKQESNPAVKSEIARILMTAVLNGKDYQL